MEPIFMIKFNLVGKQFSILLDFTFVPCKENELDIMYTNVVLVNKSIYL